MVIENGGWKTGRGEIISVHSACFHLSKVSWLSVESGEDSISFWAAAGVPSPGQAGRGNQEQLQQQERLICLKSL